MKWEAVAQEVDGHPDRFVIVVTWHPGDDLFMEQVAVIFPRQVPGTWALNMVWPGTANVKSPVPPRRVSQNIVFAVDLLLVGR